MFEDLANRVASSFMAAAGVNGGQNDPSGNCKPADGGAKRASHTDSDQKAGKGKAANSKRRRNRKKKAKSSASSTSLTSHASTVTTLQERYDEDDDDSKSDASSVDEDGLALLLADSSKKRAAGISFSSRNSLRQQRQHQQVPRGNHGASILRETPHYKLRETLMTRYGYLAQQIDEATREMWERGMPYDQLEAVLEYLQEEGREVYDGVDAVKVQGRQVGQEQQYEEERPMQMMTITTTAGPSDELASTTPVSVSCPTGIEEDDDVDDLVGAPAEVVAGHEPEDEHGANIDQNEANAIFRDEKVNKHSSSPSAMTSVGSECEMTTAETLETTFDADTILSLSQRLQSDSCDGDDDNEEKADDEHSEVSTPVPAHVHPRLAMAEKLDVVAGFESLTDAIFALTEWVNKAAKPSELDQLCKAEATTALPSVIKRAILECKDNTKDDTSVLPSLLRLLSSLLSRCDVKSDVVREVEASLEDILKEARIVYLCTDSNSDEGQDGIPNRVARFITSHISHIVKEAQVSTVAEPVPSKRRDPISTLLWKREMQKIEAKRAGNAAQSSMTNWLVARGIESSGSGTKVHSNTVFDLSAEDAMLALVDEDTKASFDMQKTVVEELESEAGRGESEAVQELRESLDSVESERLTVQEKIAKLKAALVVLETQDEELAQQIGSLKGSILKQQLDDGERAKKLNDQLEQAKAVLKYGNSIKSLAVTLTTYSKSMKKAARHFDESNKVESSASSKMFLFLQHVRNYFLSEAECLQQLRHRIHLNRLELSDLQLDLGQCEGAGLDINAIELEESIAIKKTQINADSKRVASFLDDASVLFEEMIGRLEEYSVAAKAEDGGLEPVHLSILQGVPAAVKILKIPNATARLEDFMSSIELTDEESVNNFKVLSEASSVSKPPPPPPVPRKPLQPSITQQENISPRLTWARKAIPSTSTTARKSLLDIQKEELESKCHAKPEEAVEAAKDQED